MQTKWIWSPNIGVNEFFVDKECPKDLLRKYNLKLSYIDEGLADDELDFHYISNELGFSMVLSNDLICSGFEIWKNLYLNDIEIAGLPVDKFIHIMNDMGVNDLTLDPEGYCYESKELSALFRVEDDIVTSVSC